MKRMLINATHSEEIRVALANGQKLYNLDIDVPGQDRKKGNIYKGKITRVEPSLEAAFVDYGANRHGFLPYKEISRNYYTEAANKAKERPPIAKAIKEGTEVIIQVNKEERGNKGAAVSTYISLAGRYMVYMPENPKAGGISRRIEGKARQQLKETLNNITLPKNSGIIVRTAGIGRTTEELSWDLNYLDQVWTAIKTAATVHKAPHFLYQESDIFIRALRDYLRPDVNEILIDDKKTYEKARDFMQQVMPHNLKKLSFYDDTIPLFSRYQIESQIQSAFSREVQLPSGGSLVIDHTEALISIDINSARATKGSDIEETALNTNLEAADEIARQMRIRDLGGLVVIDFIDMRNHKNQRLVEQKLNEAVSNDRARVQTSKISRFGLLEMSRQRLKSSINESSQFACPRCSGHGFIRNIESLSVSIIRILEEEALKPETGKVIAQVPTKVANFIINEKREELNNLENRHAVPMLIVANEYYQSPQFDVKRVKKSEMSQFELNNIQLNKPESEEQAENKSSQKYVQKREHAAVDLLVPESQAPERPSKGSLVGWIKSLFTSNKQNTSAEAGVKKPAKKSTSHKNNKNNKNNKSSGKQNQKQPANKNHNKKTANNKQNNKNHKKPNNQAPNKKPQPKHSGKPTANKQQHNKTPNNKQQKGQVNKQKPNNQANNQQKTDDSNGNGQIMQRPLGSVASYAANKAKQKPPQKETIKNNKSDTSGKKPDSDKHIAQQTTAKNTNNKKHTSNMEQSSQKDKVSVKDNINNIKTEDTKVSKSAQNTTENSAKPQKSPEKKAKIEDKVKSHVKDDKTPVIDGKNSQTTKSKDTEGKKDKVVPAAEKSLDKKTNSKASNIQEKTSDKKDEKPSPKKAKAKASDKVDTDKEAPNNAVKKKDEVKKEAKATTQKANKNIEAKQPVENASATSPKETSQKVNSDKSDKADDSVKEKTPVKKQQKKVTGNNATKDDNIAQTASETVVKKTPVKKTATKKKTTKKATAKPESKAQTEELNDSPQDGKSSSAEKSTKKPVKKTGSDKKASVADNAKNTEKPQVEENKAKTGQQKTEKPAKKTNEAPASVSKGKEPENTETKSQTKTKSTKKTTKKTTKKKTLVDVNQQNIDFDI